MMLHGNSQNTIIAKNGIAVVTAADKHFIVSNDDFDAMNVNLLGLPKSRNDIDYTINGIVKPLTEGQLYVHVGTTSYLMVKN